MSQIIQLVPTSGPGSGTVTSITFNGGLTSTPDPVTTTGTATIDQTNLTILDGTVYWDTGTQLLHTTATGSAGQVLTSQGAGLPPIYAAAPGTTLTFNADSGSATPAAGVIHFLGGANISSAAAGSTVSYALTGTTNHTVQLGNSTGSLNSLANSTTGMVLTAQTGADPIWASPAASAITLTGDTGGALGPSNAFTFTGGTTGLTFSGAGTTETLTGTLVVANGGTGRATLTNHGLLVGAGAAAITQLANATNGQIPIGSTGADPVLATIAAGTGITIVNGAGSISISASGSGFTWNDVTGGSASMVAENGYVADSGSLTTLTMPTNNSLGDTIKVVGKGSGGWTIVTGLLQNIKFGSAATTATTGSLSSTNANDCLDLVCTAPSITAPIFTVVSSIGNITVV